MLRRYADFLFPALPPPLIGSRRWQWLYANREWRAMQSMCEQETRVLTHWGLRRVWSSLWLLVMSAVCVAFFMALQGDPDWSGHPITVGSLWSSVLIGVLWGLFAGLDTARWRGCIRRIRGIQQVLEDALERGH